MVITGLFSNGSFEKRRELWESRTRVSSSTQRAALCTPDPEILDGLSSCLFSNEPFEKRPVMTIQEFDQHSDEQFESHLHHLHPTPSPPSTPYSTNEHLESCLLHHSTSFYIIISLSISNGHHRSLFKRLIWKETWTLSLVSYGTGCTYFGFVYHNSQTKNERWGAGVETQKNVRGEIRGWVRVPFNETYAPSLSTIYDGA